MFLTKEPSLQPRGQLSEVEQHFPDEKTEASCHTAMGGKPRLTRATFLPGWRIPSAEKEGQWVPTSPGASPEGKLLHDCGRFWA